MTEYNYVGISSDIVVFDDFKQILVIKRKNEPYQGRWALPGGFVDKDETFLQAAMRELWEEAGLDFPPHKFIEGKVWDTPDRDPRGRTVSHSFIVKVDGNCYPKAGDDALEFSWVSAFQGGLAFDHDSIVSDALKRLDLAWTTQQ